MKRTLCVQSPASMRLSHGLLSVEVDYHGPRLTFPIEDIRTLVIESQGATVSSALMGRLVESGVSVITCNAQHMPNGTLLPIRSNARHLKVARMQLNMSKPLAKQLWKRIVVRKIENQATVLELTGQSGLPLRKLAKEVKSGDTTSRESVAASIYFRALFQDGGRRQGAQTAPLDYGYALLRASIAREVTAAGWLPAFGIHHDSQLNPFNLADDFIEPYRPFVDLLVVNADYSEGLSLPIRQQLLSVFTVLVEHDGLGLSTLQNSIEEMASSFKRAVLNEDHTLLSLPKITGLEYATAE